MCFYHGDVDWYAERNDTYEGVDNETVTCVECGETVYPGDYRATVEQAQREEPCNPAAGWHHDDCEVDEEDRAAGNFDECLGEGETWTGSFCARCWQLREAVGKVEEAEGCKGEETQPALGKLYDSVEGYDGWEPYLEKMLKLGLHAAAVLVPPKGHRRLPDDRAHELGGEA